MLAFPICALLAAPLAPGPAHAQATRTYCAETVSVRAWGGPSGPMPGSVGNPTRRDQSWLFSAVATPMRPGSTVAGTIIFAPPQGMAPSRNTFRTATQAAIALGQVAMGSSGPPMADSAILHYATVICQ